MSVCKRNMSVCLDCDKLDIMEVTLMDDMAYRCKVDKSNLLYSTTNKFKNAEVTHSCPYRLEHVVLEDKY